MTWDLLLAGDLDVTRLAAALARLAGVPIESVDIAAHGVIDRDWDAAVLCTYEKASGDIAWTLDIYVADKAPEPPSEPDAAAFLATALAVPVLYSAESYPPSAHWLAAPDGPPTRARVYPGDDPDSPALTIDAVERPVALLPHVRVERQPEVIREHRMATPVADGLRMWLETRDGIPHATGDAAWHATNRLAAWEGLTVRMASGWPPDGWYPAAYYREDLELREHLAADIQRVPQLLAERLDAAVKAVDDAFLAGTREGIVPGPHGAGWWWRRVPDPEPWRDIR